MSISLINLVLIFLSSCLLTGLIYKIALQKNLMDIPNHRSSHTLPTPRGGGLGFILILLGYLLMSPPTLLWTGLAGAVALLSVTGLLDDKLTLSAKTRLLTQGIAAALVLWAAGPIMVVNFGIFPINLGIFGLILSWFALMWLINLYNFMDGIDGLAALEMIFICAGALILLFLPHGTNTDVSSFVWVLLVSILGFFMWNRPTAKIFMGDVGSATLGLILGFLILATKQEISLWSWLILANVFLIDATATLIERLLQKQRIYEAHRQHAYQVASRLYQSHKAVDIRIMLLNILWLLPLAVLSHLSPQHTQVWIYVVSSAPLISLKLKLRETFLK